MKNKFVSWVFLCFLLVIFSLIIFLLIINPNYLLQIISFTPYKTEVKITEDLFTSLTGWITVATLAATVTGFIVALASLISVFTSSKEVGRLKGIFEKHEQQLKNITWLSREMAERDYRRKEIISTQRQKISPNSPQLITEQDRYEALSDFFHKNKWVDKLELGLIGLESNNIDELKKHLIFLGQQFEPARELLAYIHLAFEHGLFDEERLGRRAYEVEAVYKEVVKKLEPRTY
ncbi:MAG: hypothetical protein NTV43_11255 [Methylococcales bacterium]|nr:hypothetical protein [Methylococcales bacterium]